MAKDAVAAELERIRVRDGALRASVVVREAEPDDSPIHDRFTWDDSKAASEYRLIEARNLIRTVVIVDAGRPVPAYAHVSAGGGEGYYQAISVLVQPAHRDEFALALKELRARLASAAESVAALEAAVQDTPARREQIRTMVASLRQAQEVAGAIA